jgi:nucleotide-binding universal stress UspA family protein
MANSPDVVVGVDDSPNSLHAMSVAASEGARRGTGVLAIHVWHAAATWGVPLNWPAGHNPGEYVRKRLTEEAEQLQAAREQAGEPPVTVSVEVIEGDTERELRTAGKDAPLLVLGERRHRGPTAVLGLGRRRVGGPSTVPGTDRSCRRPHIAPRPRPSIRRLGPTNCLTTAGRCERVITVATRDLAR